MKNVSDDQQLHSIKSDAQVTDSIAKSPNSGAEWVPHNFLDFMEEGNDEENSNSI